MNRVGNGPAERDSTRLRDLIALDLFVGFSSVSVDAWNDMVCSLETRLSLNPSQRICDIGCGAGALLFPLYERGYRNLAGVDFAPRLVEICRKVIPEGDFRVCEASRLTFDAETFDVVLCNSVFQYFPHLAYAKDAFREMIRILKPDSQGAVLDIPDAQKMNLYEIEATTRRRAMSHLRPMLAYLRPILTRFLHLPYTIFPHTSYERSWFAALANEYKLEYEIVDQSISGYLNSRFRFNFFFRKPKERYGDRNSAHGTCQRTRSLRTRLRASIIPARSRRCGALPPLVHVFEAI